MSFKKISVIGLGYIGLPTAAMFASRKLEVVGVDVNQKAVDTINQGKIHIVEPDLDMLVQAAVHGGYLRASTTPEEADAFLIAVPTPFKEHHEPDLSYIQAAAQSIAPVLKAGNLVILESTSPVGATEQLTQWLAHERPDLSFPLNGEMNPDVSVAHCPERVLPGKVVRELVANDRVIGGMTPRCSERSVELYRKFVVGECVTTNARTAEMAKLTENASRDVGIAFANELSLICDKYEIDVWELISLANRHPRVNILEPGPGVGGHCIAVDPWFIVSSAPDESKMIRTARRINDGKPHWVINKVKDVLFSILKRHPDRSARDIKVACMGLAFKADIDDLRESPALEITEALSIDLPCTVMAVEPNIESLPASLSSEFALVSTQEALEQADIILMLVDHKEFKSIDPARLAGRELVDTRGVFRQYRKKLAEQQLETLNSNWSISNENNDGVRNSARSNKNGAARISA